MTPRIKYNANKVGFLVEVFPDKPLQDVRNDKQEVIRQGIITMLTMAAIDINVSIWAAVDLGFIAEPDKKTGFIKLLVPGNDWDFGPAVEELEATILYAFSRIAQEEIDLEENYLANYLAGYPGVDVMIAMKHLLREGKIVEYAIEDMNSKKGEPNTYQFFTLAENRGKLWGRKQFKKDPFSEKK